MDMDNSMGLPDVGWVEVGRWGKSWDNWNSINNKI